MSGGLLFGQRWKAVRWPSGRGSSRPTCGGATSCVPLDKITATRQDCRMADTCGAGALYCVLKDFQPALAALVALAAAALAYQSAMAKVEHDRAVRIEDQLRTKLAVQLQLDSAAQRLGAEIQALLNIADASDALLAARWPKRTPELDAAWANPTALPAMALAQFEAVRYNLRFCEGILETDAADDDLA